MATTLRPILRRSASSVLYGTTRHDQGRPRRRARRHRHGGMITYAGTNDPTTRRMLEGILAMEEEHADDLVNLLEELGK